MAIKLSIEEAEFELEFKLEPPISCWQKSSESQDRTRAIYEGDGYTLVVEERPAEDHILVEFTLRRDSGEPFVLHEYVLESHSSAVGVDKIWMPWHLSDWVESVGLQRYVRHSGGPERTMATSGIPIIAALDRSGTAKLAVAFLDQRIETEIRHHVPTTHPTSSQARGTVNFRLQRPIDGYSLGEVVEHRDGIFVSSGSSWFDTVGLLRSAYDRRTGRRFRPSPDPAWEPLLAPWGATKGNWDWMQSNELGPDDLCEIAELAAELGFGGFMNYTGWFLDEQDEFREPAMPEGAIWGFPDYIGDFVPSRRFPDFKGFVSQLRSIGMIWLPWIAPWVVGRQTGIREQLKDALIEVDMDPSDPRYNVATSFLCPRNPVTQEYVPELMARVLREYEFDGLVVDMIDSIR